jgi:regulator of cell morphogenesis and NO signaling
MRIIGTQQSIGEIVAEAPDRAVVFESLGIDYCGGRKKTLSEACYEKGVDVQAVLRRLCEIKGAAPTIAPDLDVTSMSLTELVDHIEKTHHANLREELPRLEATIRKLVAVHGDSDPRLHQVASTFRAMAGELSCHVMKEEESLFPRIRQLEASVWPPFYCGTVANPIRQMELEHDDADMALVSLRELTDNFTPPKWACKTYRALLIALAAFERDMHFYIHKENNVLFPRAVEMEALRRRGTPVA